MTSPQLSSFGGVNSTSLALSCLIDLIPALEELVVLMSLARHCVRAGAGPLCSLQVHQPLNIS